MALVDDNLKAMPDEQALSLQALPNETSGGRSINNFLESEGSKGFWI
jgi:hypothetical protein